MEWHTGRGRQAFGPGLVERMKDKRFYIIGGKGGVGRSTVAAALGQALASQGKRTLILEMDAEQTIPLFFNRSGTGYEPSELSDNLFTANLTPDEAQQEYGLMKLKSRAAYKLVFENPLMTKMLNMVPGLRELLLLGKAWFTEQSRHPDGTPEWDAIVMDGPATGHSVSLFRLPRVILSMMKVGPMASDAREILDLLTDPHRCSFWIVTLPEELPVNECLELARINEEELHLPLDRVIVNQCWSTMNAATDHQKSEQPVAMEGVEGVEETLAYMEERIRSQSTHEQSLKDIFGERCSSLPFVPQQPLGKKEVHELARYLLPTG